MTLQFDDPSYAAVILAGGEGVRLSSFTREIFGYHLPKQFCPLFDGTTLLEQTMRRVSILVPLSQTITVLNGAHERFYSALLVGRHPEISWSNQRIAARLLPSWAG